MTDLRTLTTEQLLEHRHRLDADLTSALAIGWTEAAQCIAEDLEAIQHQLNSRIPTTHILQIEAMKEQLNLGSNDSPKLPQIKPEQHWQHKHQSTIAIVVNMQTDGFWQCSMQFGSNYLMAVHLRPRTIYNLFNLIG